MNFNNNQGVINGKVITLFIQDKEKLKKYTETLNTEQKNKARKSLKTFISIQKNLNSTKKGEI